MSKQEHPYAQVLRWIADGERIEAAVHDGSGGRVWEETPTVNALVWVGRPATNMRPEDFRLKPRTITINGHEVPEPLRVSPQNGRTVYIPVVTSDGLWHGYEWHESSMRQWLERGFCHTTREAAEAHARALLSFTTTVAA